MDCPLPFSIIYSDCMLHRPDLELLHHLAAWHHAHLLALEHIDRRALAADIVLHIHVAAGAAAAVEQSVPAGQLLVRLRAWGLTVPD